MAQLRLVGTTGVPMPMGCSVPADLVFDAVSTRAALNAPDPATVADAAAFGDAVLGVADVGVADVGVADVGVADVGLTTIPAAMVIGPLAAEGDVSTPGIAAVDAPEENDATAPGSGASATDTAAAAASAELIC